jgi:hypothetical protein
MNRHRVPCVIAALAMGLLLRVWFVTMHSQVGGDALVYGDIAKNWLQHGIYGLTEAAGLRSTLMRLPGYPLFLAICFKIFGIDHYTPALWVQCIVDLTTCLLVSDIAKSLAGEDERAGLIALWLAALSPFTANYVAAPLTETLSLFCVALTFFGLIRWQRAQRSHGTFSTNGTQRSSRSDAINMWILVISVPMGYAILLRPDGGLLPAAVVPAMVWIVWRRGCGSLSGYGAVIVCSVLTLLPLIPWTVRNERTFHMFQPLAPRYANDPGQLVSYGFQHWYRTWAIDFASTKSIYWRYDGDPLAIVDLPARAFDSQQQYQQTDALFNDYNDVLESTATIDDRFGDLAEERVAANPLRYYLLLPVARVANMWLRPRTELLDVPSRWWKYEEHPKTTIFAALYAALNLGYLVMSVIGLKRALHDRDNLPVLWASVGFIGIRSLLLATVDNSEPRYVLECFPIVIALAGISCCGKRPNLDDHPLPNANSNLERTTCLEASSRERSGVVVMYSKMTSQAERCSQ